MSRILLVGVGCPSFVVSDRHLGPGLRTGHFAVALARAGHELLVLCADVTGEQAPGSANPFDADVDGRPVRCVMANEATLTGGALRDAIDRFAPQGVVGATAYGAALAARLMPRSPVPRDGDAVPFWADVFGDLMAEAQAKAAAHGSDLSVVRFWTTLRAVLERGDRFSAVSHAQASALVGQLGLAGRLSSATAGQDLVSVIPCAGELRREAVPDPVVRGRRVPPDAFVVLWSGSFNTWCDVDTLVEGVEGAMERRESIHFVATGGGVAGHDERTIARFAGLVARSRFRDRFLIDGWVRDDLLPAYYEEADVGVCIERDLYERRLGAENRVVQWLVHGLPCVTTGLSELGRALVGEGACFSTTTGDADALAAVLVDLSDDRRRLREAGERCRRAAARFGYVSTATPLLDWADRPVAAGDAAGRRPLSIGLLSRPGDMAEVLEAYLAELSVGQIGYRSARWLWRRLRSNGSGWGQRGGAGCDSSAP